MTDNQARQNRNSKTELIEYLQAQATTIRKDILSMIYAAQSGHPGGSLSSAPLSLVAEALPCRSDCAGAARGAPLRRSDGSRRARTSVRVLGRRMQLRELVLCAQVASRGLVGRT